MYISIDPAGLVTGTVAVDEATAMDDVELARFMQRHRLPNGDNDLPVDGRDTLATDERSQLAETLEAQQCSRAQSPGPYSRPLDLTELDTRLQQVSLNTSSTLRPESQTVHHSSCPTPPFDPTRCETDAYHDLVNDGGRPVYPIGIIQDVYRNLQNYTEILLPWQVYENSPNGIFLKQWPRWQDFCKWQNDNRNRDDDDAEFEAYFKRAKHLIWRDNPPSTRGKLMPDIEAHRSCLKSRWQSKRQLQRRCCREHGWRGFPEYSEAVKRRLERYGIEHPFELDEDPKKQDTRTTWIEYINYEYWWFDLYASDVERLKPEHDKLWQKLVDKKILKTHETEEYLRTPASGTDSEVEKERASKVVQWAKLKANRFYYKDLRRLDIPKANQIRMLDMVIKRMNAANQSLELAHKRSRLIRKFVQDTFDYDIAKRNAADHRMIVQWALKQLHLVESGVNLSSNDRSGRSGLDGTRGTKRSQIDDQEQAERPDPKMARFNFRDSRMAYARTVSKATETWVEEK